MSRVYLKTPEGRIIQTDSPHYRGDSTRLTAKAGEKAYQEQAAATLRKYFKPGDVAHTALCHVSSSGMSRHIAVIATERRKVTGPDGKVRFQSVPVNVSATVAALLGYKMNKRCDSLVVGGCGMDMGFHVVYSMSYRMFPQGTAKPHGRRNGKPNSDGGYAIRHSWL